MAIGATTGVPFYGPVAQITGLTSGNTYQLLATVNWGDGTANSNGYIHKGVGNIYYVSGWHNYEKAGIFTVTVTIEATSATPIWPIPLAGGKPTPVSSPIILIVATVTDTATVAQGKTPVPGSGVTLDLTAGTAFTGSVGTFVYTGAIASTQSLYASINWGDGVVTAGSLVSDSALGAGGYSVVGSHTYTVAGTYKITTTVTLSYKIPIPVPTPASISRSGGSTAMPVPIPLPPVILVTTINSTADVAPNPNGGPGAISVVNGVLTIIGTAGNDTITVREISPGILWPVTTGASSIAPILPYQTYFNVTINGKTTTLTANGIKSVYVNGGAGNDYIDLGGLSHLTGAYPPPWFPDNAVKVNAVIHGGGGNDTLIGGDGTDSLYADNGNDELHATPGGDFAFGGTGDDTAINIGGYQFAFIAPDIKHVINLPPPPIVVPGGAAGSTTPKA